MSEQETLHGSMSSRGDSPARTSATQESGKASRGNGRDSGQSLPASFASYDPDTSSWRTSQLCLFGGWELFSETWPRAGMMLSGRCYQRAPLAHHIHDQGCSFWPTPQAQDAKHAAPTDWELSQQETGKQLHLHTALYQILGERGAVHPQLSEWLMGFPIGWTDLEP